MKAACLGAIGLLMLWLPTIVRAQCEPAWDSAVGSPGASSTVWTTLAVNEPSAIGPAVYIGGQFTSAGGTSALRVARWDGSAWSALGSGTTSGTVYAFAAKDGVLYVGGGFASIGGVTTGTRGIAQWDGANWSTVGGGMSQSNSGVRALLFWGDDLYAGGYMNEMGGATLHKLGRWNGVSWSALPGDPIGTIDSVAALGLYDDGDGEGLYVGGDFASAGGNSNAANIFRWDGTNLSPLGRGTNGVVESICAWNGSLYVGGHFTRVYQDDGTEVIANKIARWDGTEWHDVGGGMNSLSGYHVWALNRFDDGNGEALYAGGSFNSAGGASIKYLARWDGVAWSNVGQSNLNGYVYSITTSTHDGGLYAGGTFSTSGTPSAARIARWAGPLPASPLDIASDEESIALGESATLTASSPGADIDWYTGGCGDELVGTGGLLKVTPSATTTYFARAFDGTCSSYACGEITITVDCTPADPTDAAANPDEILVGESTTLSASAAPGTEIHWFTDGCGATLVGTSGVLSVSPTADTTYYAQAWNGVCYSDGCASVDVVVNCIPLEITTQPTGGTICPAAVPNVQLCVTAEGTGVLHYQWRRNSFSLIGAVDNCYTATAAGVYSCVVTDDCTPVISADAVVAEADPAAGDFDGDGDADLADLDLLIPCLTGPAASADGACACLDAVPDGHVDLLDFAALQARIGG
ncbi:MAG TPA: hypothetical protein P5572_11485 [Phycisphaerae bacterium]|nr:hypothetical protein [Phycisphaerae bacterium]